MSRRPAQFSQADINRALRAIAQAGVRATIEICQDGAIRITPEKAASEPTESEVAPRKRISFNGRHAPSTPAISSARSHPPR